MKILALILGWLFGLRFADDNHVKPILRNGLYHRVGGPGFFWIIPLVETTLPAVKMGLHVAELEFDEILSQDCVACRINVTVLFSFNPRLAIKNAAAQLVRTPTYILQAIVRDYANEGIRLVVSRFNAEELRGEIARANIKRNLVSFLTAELRSLGIAPLHKGGILVKELYLPEKYKQPVLSSRHLDRTLQTIAPFPEPDLVDLANQSVLASNLDSKDVTLMLTDFSRKEPKEASYVLDMRDLLKQRR